MKRAAILLLCLLVALGAAAADDDKAQKGAKAKPAAKSDKNFAQRAESSTGKFLHDNKIWTKSEPRGTAQKKQKPAKKSD